MSYNVEATSFFKKQAKRLIRKFPSLHGEINALVNSLEENPVQGTSIGNNCYKIRVAIASKGTGKSGGARVITHVHFSGSKVFLLSIYDKSERSDISDNEIISLLNGIQDLR